MCFPHGCIRHFLTSLFVLILWVWPITRWQQWLLRIVGSSYWKWSQFTHMQSHGKAATLRAIWHSPYCVQTLWQRLRNFIKLFKPLWGWCRWCILQTVHIIDAFKTLVMRLTAAQLGSTAKATDTMMAQFFYPSKTLILLECFEV